MERCPYDSLSTMRLRHMRKWSYSSIPLDCNTLHAPASLPPEKETPLAPEKETPVPIEQGLSWTPEPIWMLWRRLEIEPHFFSCPGHSLLTTHILVCWLWYLSSQCGEISGSTLCLCNKLLSIPACITWQMAVTAERAKYIRWVGKNWKSQDRRSIFCWKVPQLQSAHPSD